MKSNGMYSRSELRYALQVIQHNKLDITTARVIDTKPGRGIFQCLDTHGNLRMFVLPKLATYSTFMALAA